MGLTSLYSLICRSGERKNFKKGPENRFKAGSSRVVSTPGRLLAGTEVGGKKFLNKAFVAVSGHHLRISARQETNLDPSLLLEVIPVVECVARHY